MTTAYLKAMTELENQKKENKNLKDLLEQVYEMSGLDDMINSGCLDRDDDEFLMCNLSLKSEIMQALEKRLAAKKLKVMMTEGLRSSEVMKLKHNSSAVTAEHYVKGKN